MKPSIQAFTLLACVHVLCADALAQSPTGTLKKIQASGSISVGHREASLPFSMEDENKNPIGYTLDICAAVIENMKKELALPNLKVKYVQVKSSNRIQKVADGEIDMECGSTTNTRERSAQVTFSNTIFITSSRILTKASSGIKGIDDLKGRKVAIAQGASVAPLLTKVDLDKGLNLQYVRVKDFPEGFQSVDSGKAEAFVSDDIQFVEYIGKSSHGQDYAIVGEALSIDPLGIMMRKDDAPLHDIVNRTIGALVASGDMNKIYNKWFLSKTVKFPMTEPLKKILKSPNNTPNY